jgi:hypothetical protein
VILKKSYQDALEERTAMTVDPNSIDLVSSPDRDEVPFGSVDWNGHLVARLGVHNYHRLRPQVGGTDRGGRGAGEYRRAGRAQDSIRLGVGGTVAPHLSHIFSVAGTAAGYRRRSSKRGYTITRVLAGGA